MGTVQADPLFSGYNTSWKAKCGMPASSIHDSPFSGAWYPGERAPLSDLLDELWRKSGERTGGCLVPGGLAFLVPHAGLVYSGTVAAAVYRHLEQQQPRTVLLAGFSHRGGAPGISIPDIDGFATPLGQVAVDRELAASLLAEDPFRSLPEEALCDHSVEIQLPLLQWAVPHARVVPLYVGSLDAVARERAAKRLSECLSPGTVLLASSDLTHFGRDFRFQPFPADGAVSDRLRQLDDEVIDAAGSLREQIFFEALRETSATVCGRDPIALLLATVSCLSRDNEVFQDVLDYQTSGEITGDFHSSVSYGALGFFPHSSFELNEEEQAAVLKLAGQTLAEYQRTGSRRIPDLPPSGLASLARRAALFVTLHKDGRLRGCLGRTAATQSIESAVPELTLAAALEDTRFDPVSTSETGLEVEVSILSPLKRIARREDFRVNQHGALLKAKGRMGILLPQVATERNWNADQFFQALATKTGVSPDVYDAPSTRIHVFRAQIIR
jgi:AmmeMemoRadiSam system protein B/AmmeMemoRadiSam system protein A